MILSLKRTDNTALFFLLVASFLFFLVNCEDDIPENQMDDFCLQEYVGEYKAVCLYNSVGQLLESDIEIYITEENDSLYIADNNTITGFEGPFSLAACDLESSADDYAIYSLNKDSVYFENYYVIGSTCSSGIKIKFKPSSLGGLEFDIFYYQEGPSCNFDSQITRGIAFLDDQIQAPHLPSLTRYRNSSSLLFFKDNLYLRDDNTLLLFDTLSATLDPLVLEDSGGQIFNHPNDDKQLLSISLSKSSLTENKYSTLDENGALIAKNSFFDSSFENAQFEIYDCLYANNSLFVLGVTELSELVVYEVTNLNTISRHEVKESVNMDLDNQIKFGVEKQNIHLIFHEADNDSIEYYNISRSTGVLTETYSLSIKEGGLNYWDSKQEIEAFVHSDGESNILVRNDSYLLWISFDETTSTLLDEIPYALAYQPDYFNGGTILGYYYSEDITSWGTVYYDVYTLFKEENNQSIEFTYNELDASSRLVDIELYEDAYYILLPQGLEIRSASDFSLQEKYDFTE